MTEGLFDALRRDCRSGLTAGRGRAAVYPRDGRPWLAGWALGSLLIGIGLYLTQGYQGGFASLNGAATALPHWLWQGLTLLGDERVAFALSLFVARHHPQIFWSMLLAGLAAAAYTHGLKPAFATLRPPAVLAADQFQLIGPQLRHESFPSGHSVTAAVLFGVLVYYAPWRALRILGILVAVAAALSRVAVGVHWPVDVAAGLFGGVLAAGCGIWLAGRTDWGIRDVSVHLAFVTLAGIVATALLLWDGGYPAAAPMQWLIGVGALSYALTVYLAWPIGRWALSRLRMT